MISISPGTDICQEWLHKKAPETIAAGAAPTLGQRTRGGLVEVAREIFIARLPEE